MPFPQLEGGKLPASADFHVYLRDGAMMDLVVPTIRKGGPNLLPPIVTVQQALEYRRRLETLKPRVKFLMSLYLHESVTPETIIKAKNRGITWMKGYPAGVTTNSPSGVVDYAHFYPLFEEMQRQDLTLNLHGECPSKGDITVMSAEERFLPILFYLHERFPKLRTLLEHLSTSAAVEALTMWPNGGRKNYCTPLIHHCGFLGWRSLLVLPTRGKDGADRDALLRAAASGNPKFFFGSDRAPHPPAAKRGGDEIAAGVFTQPYTTQNVPDALEQACENGLLK